MLLFSGDFLKAGILARSRPVTPTCFSFLGLYPVFEHNLTQVVKRGGQTFFIYFIPRLSAGSIPESMIALQGGEWVYFAAAGCCSYDFFVVFYWLLYALVNTKGHL